MFEKLLIANRGEVALRVARAASELGIASVAVYAPEDAESLHLRRCDEAVALPGQGAGAYLDAAALIEAARLSGCDAVHPGYGFLSENAAFARACADAGLTFVGPAPETLALFGDKVAARRLAEAAGVPLAAGTQQAVSLAESEAFMAKVGGPVMLKALAGGGGRGMRLVERPDELAEAYRRAASEAAASFGSAALYVEELIRPARHIEVQVLGDATGAVTHLWERECSLQRRHQKLVELAPAPGLSDELRAELASAAVRLGEVAGVRTLCTVEFLLQAEEGRFVFMEANPRLQVEHPVTEEVTGVDLVQAQLRLAAGESLADLGLSGPPAPPRGLSVEVRVNLERVGADGSSQPSGGTLTAFEPPGGAGVRVESFGYAGYRTTTAFDSLLAKVIATAPSGRLADALGRCYRALSEFRIEGVETNLPFLQGLLLHSEVVAGAFDTGLVTRHAADLVAELDRHPKLHPAAGGATAVQGEEIVGPPGTEAVLAPMGGRLVALEVSEGDAVAPGQTLAILEAMKMEHQVTAPLAGTVRAIPVAPGESVVADSPLLFIEPGDGAGWNAACEPSVEAEESGYLQDLRERRRALSDAARPEAVARQQRRAALTARERIAHLVDPESFFEIGSLIRNPRVEKPAPADGVVVGTARIEGRPVMVMSQDFTVFGGSSGHLGGDKMERGVALAMAQGLPLILLLDGGGHRIQDGQSSRAYAAAVPIFHDIARLSGWVPMASAVLGAGFAANTNYSSMSDLVVMVRGLSTMGLAGPALVKAGTGESVTAEALGGTAVQVDRQGLADLGLDSETEALEAIRGFLSYLPSNARALPPVRPPGPPAGPIGGIVPANSRRAYDMQRVIAGLVDAESCFELKPTFARNIITCFARLEGSAVGLVANQPLYKSGMLDAEACEKAAHFIALCDAFGLPLIYLVDIPGLSIGPAAERATLGRRSAKMLFELGHATVPRISVVLRKGYGLGYLTMAGGRSFDADACFAWPTAEICAMSVEGSVDVAYRRDYEAAADPAARRRALIAEIRAEISPIKAAEGFGIDEVIEPEETRPRLLDLLARVPARRDNRLPAKYRAISPI